MLPPNYEEVRGQALACTRCRLSDSRTQVVFSDGSPTARLMVVGEAPGANEDQTGVPFVGAAGKFLDMLLSTVDLSREDSVYIANVLKCRPPGNRNPMPDEIEACSPFLKKQIELVQPEALLAVGTFSAPDGAREDPSRQDPWRGSQLRRGPVGGHVSPRCASPESQVDAVLLGRFADASHCHGRLPQRLTSGLAPST